MRLCWNNSSNWKRQRVRKNNHNGFKAAKTAELLSLLLLYSSHRVCVSCECLFVCFFHVNTTRKKNRHHLTNARCALFLFQLHPYLLWSSQVKEITLPRSKSIAKYVVDKKHKKHTRKHKQKPYFSRGIHSNEFFSAIDYIQLPLHHWNPSNCLFFIIARIKRIFAHVVFFSLVHIWWGNKIDRFILWRWNNSKWIQTNWRTNLFLSDHLQFL